MYKFIPLWILISYSQFNSTINKSTPKVWTRQRGILVNFTQHEGQKYKHLSYSLRLISSFVLSLTLLSFVLFFWVLQPETLFLFFYVFLFFFFLTQILTVAFLLNGSLSLSHTVIKLSRSKLHFLVSPRHTPVRFSTLFSIFFFF